MTQGLFSLITEPNIWSKPQAFTKVTYHGFFKCEGKCYPNTQLELHWKMLLLIIFFFIFILFYFIFILIFNFILCFYLFYVLFHFIS